MHVPLLQSFFLLAFFNPGLPAHPEARDRLTNTAEPFSFLDRCAFIYSNLFMLFQILHPSFQGVGVPHVKSQPQPTVLSFPSSFLPCFPHLLQNISHSFVTCSLHEPRAWHGADGCPVPCLTLIVPPSHTAIDKAAYAFTGTPASV